MVPKVKMQTSAYELVPVENLLLDAKNPRLVEIGIPSNPSQFDLTRALWEKMAVEEVAMSIAYSGYFDHEPLFVETNRGGKAIVIEGNRRLAAVNWVCPRSS